MAKNNPAGGKKGGDKPKRKGGPPNPFILFFLDTLKKEGGNPFNLAKVCGKRWKSLPSAEKDKYRRRYCAACKKCKGCDKIKPEGADKKSSGGGKKGGGGKC